MSRISIVTVNFNQPEATIDLLQSIKLYQEGADLEVILVDNGSTENREIDFIAAYDDLKFIRSDINLGFAGGNNIGIVQATGDFLFLVNNDTEFTTGLLAIMLATMEANSSIGMLSPKIMYFDQPDVIQYAGFTDMNFYTARNHCVGQFETDRGQYDHIVAPTGYAHGAAMMISRHALVKAGNMAEHFFLYFEEMDWCEKIKAAGFEVWVNTNATIFHKESLAVGKNSALKTYFMNRNRILFIRRNARAHHKVVFYLYFALIVTPRNCLKYIMEGNISYIKVLFQAIYWNLTNTTFSRHLGYKIK